MLLLDLQINDRKEVLEAMHDETMAMQSHFQGLTLGLNVQMHHAAS